MFERLNRLFLLALIVFIVNWMGLIVSGRLSAQEKAKTEEKTKAQKPAAKPQPKVADSGKTYVVAKGDNPVTIAKKFKVSYDDLVALNHIDDPRKLKIGQKLLIPEKLKNAKKNE